MKHTKYLRAGSLVCLLALCLGLLTACGGATLPLDKLYVDDMSTTHVPESLLR